ncbi:MAG: GNAT family N-acetyltransferase [Bacteroidota bacterium]
MIKVFSQIDESNAKWQIPNQFLYYQPGYLQLQQHKVLQAFENDHFSIPFNLHNDKAISIDRSPFGSFLRKQEGQLDSYLEFNNEITQYLKAKIKSMIIHHPSPIYADFIDCNWLTKVGYSIRYNDINQHIVLDPHWQSKIHNMQSRKLKALKASGFQFRHLLSNDIGKVHQFLKVCRQAQGLQINIELPKLKALVAAFPQSYDLFGIFRDEKMSAACIAVKVNSKIAYYYLAGTSPLFRTQSPMVLLIAGMTEHYTKLGFEFFDLGISSQQGQPQETLRIFKQRMGAVESTRPTFTRAI